MEEARDTSDVVAKTRDVLRLIRATGDLLHCTQRERGGSSVFLGSSGTKFESELADLRAESDHYVEEFLQSCTLESSQPLLLGAEHASSMRMLARLAPIRSGVDKMTTTAREAIEYFADLNETLLSFCGALIEQVPGTAERAEMLSLLALLRTKELSGAERAILAQVFAEDRFTDGTYLWTIALISAQEILLRIAASGADETFAGDLARVNASTSSQRVIEFENVALVNGVKDLGIDPESWFEQTTARIDLLKELEDQFFDRLDQLPVEVPSADHSDYDVSEAISATVLAMGKLRSHVDRVRRGELAYRDFVRGSSYGLQQAEQQLTVALQTTELTARATRDELTGVLNRSAVPSLIKAAMRRQKPGHLVAALMVDLDNFKVINDSLGHTVGDLLLTSVAQRIRQSIRPLDVLTRVGGDEFMVIGSPIESEKDAHELASRILAHGREAHVIEGRELHVGMTIGIGLGQNGTSTETLLREADIALHRAKNDGRGGYVVLDDELRRDVRERHEVELGIRQALTDHTIRAHFQPIVALETGHIEAVETLARWESPDGVRSASEFCQIAEEAGLMPQVDEMVMRSAFANRPAVGNHQPAISINISDLQLRQAMFAERLREEMMMGGVSPNDVWIEVIEHHALTTDQAISNLERLREIGCTIALDDFGSGFSALSMLRTLPIDVVKIDGEFVRGIDTDAATRQTVKSILDILNALGLRSVAEGIETQQELEVLASLGCEMGQGFHLALPSPNLSTWTLPNITTGPSDTLAA